MENEKFSEYFGKLVNLNELTKKKKVSIWYPDERYSGRLIKSKFQERNYYHLVFEEENEKHCIKTIFLREKNLKYFIKKSEEIILISKKDFCPIWTHYKPAIKKKDEYNNIEKEYFELEKILNEK